MGADHAAAAVRTRAQFRAYVRRRGLTDYQDWGVPEATQLLRHGFAQRVPNLGLGELPGGLGHGWLAHASFATTSGSGIEEHEFTVVITRVAASIGFAVRVVCHDRGLSEEERANPNADAEVVELDDRDVEVESVRFLERYAVATDHDQDRVRTWRLFSPALIDWLTADAPPRFSFELQDGALCCFVESFIADEPGLDALLAAAKRVHDRVLELAGGGSPAAGAGGPTRSAIVEAELAAHPFDRPPESTWAAARRFGWLGLVTGRSRRLGAEAFFRAYAADRGFERVGDEVFRAGHIDTPMPGEITQVAAGRLDDDGPPAWLLLTKEERPRSGWTVLVVDPADRDRLYLCSGLPETKAAEDDGYYVVTDDRSLIVFKPDGGRMSRSRESLDAFVDVARTVALALVEAARAA